MRPLLGALLLLLGTAVCSAQAIVTPMDGFWLKHGPTATTDPGNLYGPSNSSATWHIDQWGNNGPQMLPFTAVTCFEPGQTNCFLSYSPNVMAYQFTSGGTIFARLQSGGQNQPCLIAGQGGGNPYELDLLIEPTNSAVYGGFPNGVLAHPGLSTIAHLIFGATISVKYMASNLLGGCPQINNNTSAQVTQVALNVTLNNTTANQTLFYSLNFFQQGNPVTAAGSVPLMTGQTQPFLFRDTMASYGTVPVQVTNTPINISLDMLARIQAVIAAGCGACLLDTNPANWSIGGLYVGHGTYGSIGLVTEWSNISLVAGAGMMPVSIALSSPSVNFPTSINANSLVSPITVTTTGGTYVGTLTLGGTDAAKFTLSGGGVYPTNLMVGASNLTAGTYNVSITAP